ncbi:MAG TPA: hypothetical protein VFJ16_17795 [Longimicrobium sp.]|nr:hypothetical protein [Longimicrobium sp.]
MSTRIGIDGLKGISTITGLKGVLRGVLDTELPVWDAIPNAEIVAVPVREPSPAFGAGPSRRGVTQVPHDTVKEAAAQPGALKGTTDEKGRFALATREGVGGYWRVYACFGAIHPTGNPAPSPLKREVCFDLGVYSGEKAIAADIHEALYCALMKRADQWSVYGRVTECSTGQKISGANVNAFDVDWVQDDALGTGASNGSGVYRINYPGSAFRQGTWLDIELFGGPDIFFRVTDTGGNVLIDEAPIAGRGPGRADRDCCARIDLCATVGVVPGGDGTGVFADAWIKVGSSFVIPDAAVLNDFDATGYMGAGRFALADTAKMVGDVQREIGGRPVEYRFLVSNSPTSNGGPAPADATFTRIVGDGAATPIFADGMEIGEMVRLSPLRIVKIDARVADLRPGGWLRVNDCIERVFGTTAGLSVADIPQFIWNPDALLGINTGALTTAANVPAGAAAAGSPVPGANHIPTERFALRFQIRSVNPADDTDVTPLPGDGITLNSVVVNNNDIFLKLGVNADGTMVACDPATGNITLPYTAYHPDLQTVSLALHPNLQANVFTATPLSGNTNPAVTESVNPGLFVGTLTRCGYIVSLDATARRHNGEYQVGYAHAEAVFFYE